MKKLLVIVLAIILSVVLIFICVFDYSSSQYVKEMRYCGFALEGDDEVVFHLEDGRCYKAIPFPGEMVRSDIVDALSSAESEKIIKQNGGKNILYHDPFEMGDKYVVIAPLPELPPLFPVSSIAIPFAYYAVEVES
ncbi:MAG: hypothetical protein J6W15_04705 [Clostridia bacterium]|nr:hypothetical protein [Clostridia bacterium]